MCGIAGIISKLKGNFDFSDFRDATKLMSHRGPDNFGEYYFNNIALFHYRLSILDIDKRSNQPFLSDDKEKVLTYNGELYNYKELAAQYKLSLSTTSDTEVLMKLLEIHRGKSLSELNGIFAFAYYDKAKNTIAFARDRLGVKPLYFFENDSYIAFASEAKVILKWLPKFELNLQGLSEYLWYGNTLSSRTMVNGLNKIKPGTITEIDLNSFKKTQTTYWSIASSIEPNKEVKFEQAVKDVQTLLEKAVQRQLMSDVPIGIFLSGGVDSSAITAYASRHVTGKLNTYSVDYDFNIGGKSELEKARIVADKFGTHHHQFKVESKNSVEIFEDLVMQFDEPFADPANISLYLIAKECQSEIKVVLQGDGGDELFAGYRRYGLLNSVNLWKNCFQILSGVVRNKLLKHRVKRMATIFSQKSDGLKMALMMSQSTFNNNPESIINENFSKQFSQCNPFLEYEKRNIVFENEDLVQRMLYTDIELLLQHTFLEKVDKSTMKCSIESRVPFLDNDLVDYVLALPSNYKITNGDKKHLLKQSLLEILPREILYAPKRGFDIPYKTWLRSSMYEYAKSKISQFKNLNNLINKTKLLELLEQHKNNTADNGSILWKALVLIIWLEFYENKVTI